MYTFSSVKSTQQGDEIFKVDFVDGTSKVFHIWDYKFLYSYPHLYRQLIVDLLNCDVYNVIENVLLSFIPKGMPLRIADIACGSGLMGKKMADNAQLDIKYLAGVEITAEALTALERDTPNVYNRCFLLPMDDLSELKAQNINCLILCGAANHLTLKDYQCYLSLLTEQAYIVFNLVSDPARQHHREILQWMDEQYTLLERQEYTHRRLLNGSSVFHEIFIYL